MESYKSVTDSSPDDQLRGRNAVRKPVAAGFVIIAVTAILFGVSANAAQADEATPVIVADEPAADTQVADEQDLVDDTESTDAQAEAAQAELDARDQQIQTLEEQVGLLQQALIGIGARVDDEAAQVAALGTGVDRQSAEFQADSVAQWNMGYAIGGGENLTAFINTILPCESGSQPDPDRAVGPTDDWGRAQINRPTWKERFETLTGANFEENISNPVLNGFIAAHVETEQGLSAWTCWRRR